MRKTLVLTLFCVAATFTLTGCQSPQAKTEVVKETAKNTTVEAYGRVQSDQILNVVIDFPAMLKTLPVKDGQLVKKGEVLAVLDIGTYLAQIQSKSIEVKIATQEKAKILSGTTLTLLDDLQYSKLQDALTLAESSYNQAERDYKSNEGLFKAESISQVELDRYKNQLDLKKKMLEDAKADVDQYKKSKSGVSNEVSIRDLQATASQITVDSMTSKLSRPYVQKNQIICPYDEGIVYEIGYQEGEVVDASRKLFAIADKGKLTIEAEITEEFIGDIKKGAKVEIVPVADRTKVYHGLVTDIAQIGKIKNGETIVMVNISVDDNDGFLKPNYNVDVSIAK